MSRTYNESALMDWAALILFVAIAYALGLSFSYGKHLGESEIKSQVVWQCEEDVACVCVVPELESFGPARRVEPK